MRIVKRNELLKRKVEKKAKYVKQQFYEIGPKSVKLLAQSLSKHQVGSHT